mmetsp:Transcript_24767/g.27556  ORF Transcript_24767/g.27556 Transcript_24767/m.27556 type:complete len:200 (-) Transcript_24767:219-818(-)
MSKEVHSAIKIAGPGETGYFGLPLRFYNTVPLEPGAESLVRTNKPFIYGVKEGQLSEFYRDIKMLRDAYDKPKGWKEPANFPKGGRLPAGAMLYNHNELRYFFTLHLTDHVKIGWDLMRYRFGERLTGVNWVHYSDLHNHRVLLFKQGALSTRFFLWGTLVSLFFSIPVLAYRIERTSRVLRWEREFYEKLYGKHVTAL